jgi:hypothetical protein
VSPQVDYINLAEADVHLLGSWILELACLLSRELDQPRRRPRREVDDHY